MVPEKGDLGGMTGGTSVALQPAVSLESGVEGLLLRLNAFAFSSKVDLLMVCGRTDFKEEKESREEKDDGNEWSRKKERKERVKER